jgi:hypothetical protein
MTVLTVQTDIVRRTSQRPCHRAIATVGAASEIKASQIERWMTGR